MVSGERLDEERRQGEGEVICIHADEGDSRAAEDDERISLQKDGGCSEGVWKRVLRQGDRDANKDYNCNDMGNMKYMITYVGYIVIESDRNENESDEQKQRDEIVHIDGKRCSAPPFANYIREREIVEIIGSEERLDDERDEDDSHTTRTSSKICRGLIVAVLTMRPFERAMITVTPKYGYGDKGCFSFPHIPPKSILLYDVVVMNVEPMSLGGLRSEMFFEARVKAAKYHKDMGNTYFTRCKSNTAISHIKPEAADEFDIREEDIDDVCRARSCYLCGLSYFSDDVMLQLQDASMHSTKYTDMANEIKLPLHLNVAACNLKSGLYRESVEHCTKVLQTDKENEKALLRRAKAYIKLNRIDSAEEDAIKLSKLVVDEDSAVKALFNQISNEKKRERTAQKSTFGGMFASEEGTRDPVKEEAKESWFDSWKRFTFW